MGSIACISYARTLAVMTTSSTDMLDFDSGALRSFLTDGIAEPSTSFEQLMSISCEAHAIAESMRLACEATSFACATCARLRLTWTPLDTESRRNIEQAVTNYCAWLVCTTDNPDFPLEDAFDTDVREPLLARMALEQPALWRALQPILESLDHHATNDIDPWSVITEGIGSCAECRCTARERLSPSA